MPVSKTFFFHHHLYFSTQRLVTAGLVYRLYCSLLPFPLLELQLTKAFRHIVIMFITNPQRLCITLVFYIAIVLALITASEAKGYAQPARRGHGSLNRLVKKRSPQADPKANPQEVGPVIGAGGQPPTASSTTPLPSPSQPLATSPSPPSPDPTSETPPNRPDTPTSANTVCLLMSLVSS